VSGGRVSVAEPDPKDLKEAMALLSKAVLKVFRLSSPHLTYSGALKELPSHAESVIGLQLGAAGDTLLLRSGRIEVQLYPVLSEQDEENLLQSLMAKAELRRHRQDKVSEMVGPSVSSSPET
jgi:hypothetical protein